MGLIAQWLEQIMFDSYKIYGPYNNEVRRLVVLVSKETGKPVSSMSYARYLMSVKLDRYLTDNEEVDHIDGNPLNDSIDNLQILTPAENRRKSSMTGRTMITLNCPNCGTEFTIERRQTHLIKGGSHTCCSRSCAGKYQFKG